MDLANKSNTVYLVDLENIGARALYEYMAKYPKAKYIIFFSDATSTPGSILEETASTVDMAFIDCKSGGNNAMDFCICAMAGRLTADRKKTIRILSNDKGYDPMLRMFHERGIRVKRIGITYQSISKPDSKLETGQTHTSTPLVIAIKGTVPQRYQKDVIAKLPLAANRKEAHEILQGILPQKMIPDIYKKLKKYIPKEVA